jgi:3-oxoacyl-[acyl-carrier protein] reductase
MGIDPGLTGKVAIITGGTFGIGRALAGRLVEQGAKVALCARRPGPLEQAVSALGAERALGVVADVADPDALRRLFDATVERFGRLDILVNNAGTSMRDAFERVSDEQWQSDLDMKLFAAIRTIRLAIPHMRRQGGGRIVNVTNYIAKQPFARSGPTSVSRAATLAMTKALSKEFAPENILVNAVCLGYVHAEQHERHARDRGLALEAYYEELAGTIPMARVGLTREAADAILFLVSAQASYVTGASLNVDGGLCAVL